ncbi:hypothetical protein Vafri_7780, partial [Volvox africanus]
PVRWLVGWAIASSSASRNLPLPKHLSSLVRCWFVHHTLPLTCLSPFVFVFSPPPPSSFIRRPLPLPFPPPATRRPLLRRIWWPLEELALATRTQLSGHLKPHLDPRGSGSGSDSSGVSRSGSSRDMEGPGRREGAAAWEFSIFPPSVTGIGTTDKYVAPPRRLSGLVLVGAATRLPVVRDYITEVTGLPVRPGVDPEVRIFPLKLYTASFMTNHHGPTPWSSAPVPLLVAATCPSACWLSHLPATTPGPPSPPIASSVPCPATSARVLCRRAHTCNTRDVRGIGG